MIPILSAVCNRARLIAVATVLTLCCGVASADQDMGPTLSANQSLKTKQYLASANKTYRAYLWEDGNFTVDAVNVNPWKRLWSSGTEKRAANGAVAMQSDGNLCIYGPAGGGAAWCAATNYGNGDYFLILRDSGSLEVYRGSPAKTREAQLVWTSALDPMYYLNRYDDLKRVLGTNARLAMEHWINYGQFEGRSPNSGTGDEGRQNALKVGLDTRFYADRYPDLKQAFGYDAGRLYQHWMNNGRVEGRVPSKEIDDFLAPPARSAEGLDSMRVGDWLPEGKFMASKSKRFQLWQQEDGNLVLYEGSPHPNNHRWSYGKSFGPGPYYSTLQPDGHICTYRGKGPADQRGFIACAPAGAGGPVGRYFAAVQDDGNLAIYKGGGPSDNRGWVWDRITTRASSGFNFNAIAEAVGTFVVNTANTVAGGATGAANTVVSGTTQAANDLAREATSAANVVASTAVSTANTVANGTIKLGNQVVDGTRMVGATVGKEVVKNGQIVGKEIVKNGQVVGQAVVDVANQAWAYLQNNCGDIGRSVMPIGGGQLGQAVGLLERYGSGVSEVRQGTQCYRQAEDGFYCSFPQELADLVSGSADMARNLPELARRVWGEMGSQECIYTVAATPVLPAAPAMCGLGKVMVEDAIKAFACVAAAQKSDEVKRALPNINFPSEAGCRGIGIVAFKVAEKIVTRNIAAEAKAAQAAGKSMTAAMVAKELQTVYSVAGAASKFQELTEALNRMPACGGSANATPVPNQSAMPAFPSAPVLLAAFYGAEGQPPAWVVGGVSVVDRIRASMQNGVVIVPANMNAFFGGDPLPGRPKVVAIQLNYQGQVINLRQQEGRDLRFPGREGTDYVRVP